MIKRAIVAVELVLALLLAGACASQGGSVSQAKQLTDSVSVSLISKRELMKKFGSDNPFISLSGMVTGGSHDYVDAQLTLVTTAEASVEILQAKVIDTNNKTRAWLYDRAQFADFVAKQDNPYDSSSNNRRQNLITWNYLPSQSFALKRGKYEYILVFIGKHPLPEDLQLYVRLSVNDQQQEFTLDVPNAE
jgi:hypothetical protein